MVEISTLDLRELTLKLTNKKLFMKKSFASKLLITSILCALLIEMSASKVNSEVSENKPETQLQKENYSIGYQIGVGMRSDSVAVDVDSFVQGLLAGTGGTEPVLDRGEMKALIVALRKTAYENKLREKQELLVRNAEESQAFLEKNAKLEGVITTESGLQYKILRPGDGPSPTVDDFVKVNYRGSFTDGKEFDSSYARGKPEVFQTDGVIKGWTEALLMMKPNSKWMLFVPPELAYGRGGLEGKIPPNAVLVFEIELLSFGPEEKENKDG
jgi:FKBP-type peptidyl-prolyl cis-trans isomerase FklB